jgi:hypothetical protein
VEDNGSLIKFDIVREHRDSFVVRRGASGLDSGRPLGAEPWEPVFPRSAGDRRNADWTLCVCSLALRDDAQIITFASTQNPFLVRCRLDHPIDIGDNFTIQTHTILLNQAPTFTFTLHQASLLQQLNQS